MALSPGTRLGPYEILSAVGAGGMGEVYRARDTRLNRDVAIKVLPEALAADSQFRERFDREARTISQLDHPHICPLYDVGEQNRTAYLVMQYLEGETLATRLERGALPLNEALTIAIQVASALDKAHRAGITHRDLKPGNVMLTKAGTKLLDFGLAKTDAPAVAGTSLSMLPTTPANLTAQGTILGTFQYMAPEQLDGQEADARTDIFAFGAVVYEMITGRKAFEGKSQASLIGAILERDPPPVSTLQPLSPPALDRVVQTCLTKDPDRRWQSAGDLTRELQWIADTGSQAAAPVPVVAPPKGLLSSVRFAWIVAAVALVAFLSALVPAVLSFRRTAPEPVVTRLDVVTPPSTDPFSFALSPDGRQLAFVATAEGSQRLWVRSLDQVTPRPLAGTDGAQYPFWATDARAIGFFAEGKLKRIDVAGGGSQVLADAPSSRGGTWNREGTILFTPTNTSGLMRVAAAGGPATPVTRVAAGQSSHRWAAFLPDGRHFLFMVTLGQPETRGVYVGSLDGGEPTRLLASDAAAVYAPPGYLLLVSQGVLSARPFDPVQLAITGEPIPIAPVVAAPSGVGQRVFSASDAGVLAYRGGGAGRRQLVWVDRSGKRLDVLAPPDDAALGNPEFARDGSRVAFSRLVQGNVDAWLLDVKRAATTRFTFDASVDATPVWSPDGTQIVFQSARNGNFDLFTKPADGSAEERPLLVTPLGKAPQDWSSDGRFLLYATQDPKTASDLWVLPLSGDRKPFPVVQTPFDEVQGQFSPDARWVAYVSNETGRYEVYARPFPGPGGKWQVSTGGGIYPRWRHDGKELFYIAPDNRMMAVPIQVGGTLSAGAAVALFPTELTGGNLGIGGFQSKQEYAVAADGRFLLNVTVGDPAAWPITVVLNWQSALNR
jgi:eukaryotic-like serine/threonine-protein kinase